MCRQGCLWIFDQAPSFNLLKTLRPHIGEQNWHFLLKVGMWQLIYSPLCQCVILHFGGSGYGVIVSPMTFGMSQLIFSGMPTCRCITDIYTYNTAVKPDFDPKATVGMTLLIQKKTNDARHGHAQHGHAWCRHEWRRHTQWGMQSMGVHHVDIQNISVAAVGVTKQHFLQW